LKNEDPIEEADELAEVSRAATEEGDWVVFISRQRFELFDTPKVVLVCKGRVRLLHVTIERFPVSGSPT
jgi:hypothetical protein